MDEKDPGGLGPRLETTGGSDEATPDACDLCADPVDGDAVEVRLADGGSTGPDAWLCEDCYGHVVGDLGVTPVRVFKTGLHRTVVLRAGAGGIGGTE